MPSVLRIGPRVGHDENANCTFCLASLLRSALISRFSSDEQPSTGNDCNNVINISNKYFSAQVALEFISSDQEGGSLGNEDGIVLVFDGRCSPPGSGAAPCDTSLSFDALASVHDFAVASGQAGDILRLCVGVSTEGPLPSPDGKAAEEEYSRRVLWCLDRGYEYVEADLSESGVRTGHGEQEKEGFARVVEAVANTVWNGSIMKPKGKSSLKRDLSDAEKVKQSLAVETVSTSMAEKANDDDCTRSSEDVVTRGALSVCEAKCEEIDKKKVDEVSRVDPPESFEVDNASDKTFFNDLDSVLQQAAAARAAAKSGDLSDEERRKMAGDIAMMLAGLMGEADSDESDGA